MESTSAGGRQAINKYIKKMILDVDTSFESTFVVVLHH